MNVSFFFLITQYSQGHGKSEKLENFKVVWEIFKYV